MFQALLQGTCQPMLHSVILFFLGLKDYCLLCIAIFLLWNLSFVNFAPSFCCNHYFKRSDHSLSCDHFVITFFPPCLFATFRMTVIFKRSIFQLLFFVMFFKRDKESTAFSSHWTKSGSHCTFCSSSHWWQHLVTLPFTGCLHFIKYWIS